MAVALHGSGFAAGLGLELGLTVRGSMLASVGRVRISGAALAPRAESLTKNIRSCL